MSTPDEEALGARMEALAQKEGHMSRAPRMPAEQRRKPYFPKRAASAERKERDVLDQLRLGPASYSELSKATGIASGTLQAVIKRLIAKGHKITRERGKAITLHGANDV